MQYCYIVVIANYYKLNEHIGTYYLDGSDPIGFVSRINPKDQKYSVTKSEMLAKSFKSRDDAMSVINFCIAVSDKQIQEKQGKPQITQYSFSIASEGGLMDWKIKKERKWEI